MDINELAHVIEAILFVAGEPVNVHELQRALEVTEDETFQAIDALDSDYSYHRRGICLKRFGSHIHSFSEITEDRRGLFVRGSIVLAFLHGGHRTLHL